MHFACQELTEAYLIVSFKQTQTFVQAYWLLHLQVAGMHNETRVLYNGSIFCWGYQIESVSTIAQVQIRVPRPDVIIIRVWWRFPFCIMADRSYSEAVMQWIPRQGDIYTHGTPSSQLQPTRWTAVLVKASVPSLQFKRSCMTTPSLQVSFENSCKTQMMQELQIRSVPHHPGGICLLKAVDFCSRQGKRPCINGI